MTDLEEVKTNFYKDLQTFITDASEADNLIVLGEFNARGYTEHIEREFLHQLSSPLLQTFTEHVLQQTRPSP
ncbi:hypothetical protein DPMN_077391 [Dreissena polymorpha]|uniref:Uncharacterized protein n=1 Tax=Dreissena polymorpha TaxID=45954 RepID=A0A9D3YQI0_DREPO|nr:hypothetical protein DPMN_077391 [Dreissena polymorpha]